MVRVERDISRRESKGGGRSLAKFAKHAKENKREGVGRKDNTGRDAKIANREEMALAKDTKNAKDIDKQWRREGYCPNNH